jgi:hypothetical protein
MKQNRKEEQKIQKLVKVLIMDHVSAEQSSPSSSVLFECAPSGSFDSEDARSERHGSATCRCNEEIMQSLRSPVKEQETGDRLCRENPRVTQADIRNGDRRGFMQVTSIQSHSAARRQQAKCQSVLEGRPLTNSRSKPAGPSYSMRFASVRARRAATRREELMLEYCMMAHDAQRGHELEEIVTRAQSLEHPERSAKPDGSSAPGAEHCHLEKAILELRAVLDAPRKEWRTEK